MSDAAGQKAMLTFVEVLMNNNGPLTISQLAGHFGSRNFDSEMRAAAGGNEAGLKKLLLKYPSLFTVKGNLVSLYELEDDNRTRSQSPFSDTSEPSLPDVSVEMEAVRYFQGKFAKKGDRWMPIASLAGHLSQASREVRNVVGPQLMFRSWLLRHPHIFEICDGSVGLREDIAAVVLNMDSRSQDEYSSKYLRHKQLRRDDIWRIFASGGDKSSDEGSVLSPVRQKNCGGEYAAIFYLVDLLVKHEMLCVEDICQQLNADGPGAVQNTLNNVGIEKFLQEHQKLFVVENGNVKLNINRETLEENEEEFIKEGTGIIFHVAKLWGIIDLGNHEHVFFDRSILGSDVSDLQSEYKVGDKLNFCALAAPKKSRAKWKAVKVWKSNLGHDSQISVPQLEGGNIDHLSLVSTLLDDLNVTCLNGLIGDDCTTSEIKGNDVDGGDAAADDVDDDVDSLSGKELGNDFKFKLTSLVITDGDEGEFHEDKPGDELPRRFVSVACQTLSTGDIIATSLYQSV